MKKLIFFFVVSFASLVFCGCSTDLKPPNYDFKIHVHDPATSEPTHW